MTARFAPLPLIAALVCAGTGCAGSVEVTRTFTPTAASRIDADKLQPVAILREGVRTPLPRGARVEADRMVLAGPRKLSAALRPTDGIVMQGRLAPGEPIPGGGRVESSRSGAALIGGVVVFTLAYVPTAYVGAASHGSDAILGVPFVGPWLDLVHRPACVPPASPIPLPVDPCMVETATRAALVTSGALQGLGAVLTAIGLPASSRVIEGDRGVALVPSPGGAALYGRF
ncbi:MAG TPA: hypothetical protein VGL81_27005 [Polyangiaceae bacterium]|jgi:hypothetical protein